MSKLLAYKLSELREQLGLTQNELAFVLSKSGKNFSSSYISKLENGIDLPSCDLLLRLARIYDQDINKLLTLRRKDYLARIDLYLNEQEARALNKEKQKRLANSEQQI